MLTEEANDIILIKGAQQGDVNAFQELVFRYDRAVLSIAAHYINNAEDAKDIYQEVFLRVYRGLQHFKFQSTFATWLFRITTNVCLTYRSRSRRHHHVSIEQDSGTDEPHTGNYEPVSESRTDDAILQSELKAQIEKSLEKLPPRQKLAFSLRHYENYSLKEIAEVMQCGEGTIKRYLFLATEKLRNYLGRRLD